MRKKVLIIGKVWPEPGSSAAGTRMLQLISFFQEQACELSFASASGESEFAADLRSWNIDSYSIQLNDRSFDDFVTKLNPQMVVFDRFTSEEQFGWRVALHCPDAIRVLDTEDLHGLRFARHQALKAGRSFINNDLINEVSKREIASIYRCDLSLIISQYEIRLLRDFFKVDASLLCYLPFLFPRLPEAGLNTLPQYIQRSHFISIGNFLHEPNWDAVRYLKKEIWPLIRKQLPQSELHVYGAYPSQKVFELDNKKEGFLIKGRARDAAEVMREARVCLAPLRFGAGLKGKLADAMLNGTPSVTSSIGAEGMNGDLPWPGLIADSPESFAEAAVNLYLNEELWNKSQASGFEIIRQRFSKEEHTTNLLKTLNDLHQTIAFHRQANFTGAMLMHHTISSTRYMAQWIEEKNRNKNG